MSDEDKQEIYKALYALNAEVARLRGLVEAGHAGEPAQTVIAHHPHPQDEEDMVDIQDDFHEPAKIVHDVEYRTEHTENFSIQDANEDLIRKALEKHNGNRKKAAEELGISERTLYRKLPPEYRSSRQQK